MQETIPMNIDVLIFDPVKDDKQPKTINGIPAGYMSPNYPKIVNEEGKDSSLDIAKIVEHFHGKEETVCPYTGLPVEGINAVDGNPQNFLITNLEPVSKKALDLVPFMPKVSVESKIVTNLGDFGIELFGVPHFRAYPILKAIEKEGIPQIPAELNLPHGEMQLMWIWNELTKVKLLKGLKRLTWMDRRENLYTKLTNESVAEFCIKALHADVEEQNNG